MYKLILVIQMEMFNTDYGRKLTYVVYRKQDNYLFIVDLTLYIYMYNGTTTPTGQLLFQNK